MSSSRPPSRSYGQLGASGPPLTKRQMAALCQLARRAYDQQADLGLAGPEPGESASAAFGRWRHAQQQEAIGLPSLTSARNGHYRILRAHYLALLGLDGSAFVDLVASGPAAGASGDTVPEREALVYRISEALAACPQVGIGYGLAIARRKFGRPRLRWEALAEDLSCTQLRQLLYTVRNRIAAAEGRGSPAGRNKSQRRGRRQG